jgi:Domain of unknown function (DUF1707)
MSVPMRPSHLRASDADREATATLLGRHHAEGRLDVDELQERIGRCYATKTIGELDALVADLPSDPAGRPSRATGQLRPAGWPGALVPIVALLVALALLGIHMPWLAWPLGFFLLARRGRARCCGARYGHRRRHSGPTYL